MNTLLQWHKIADNAESILWNNNNMAVVVAGEKTLTLIKLQTGLAACSSKCPHAGASLAEGFIDGVGNIVCPLHKYKFNTRNGRNVSGEGYHLKIYSIETREDGVFVGI